MSAAFNVQLDACTLWKTRAYLWKTCGKLRVSLITVLSEGHSAGARDPKSGAIWIRIRRYEGYVDPWLPRGTDNRQYSRLNLRLKHVLVSLLGAIHNPCTTATAALVQYFRFPTGF